MSADTPATTYEDGAEDENLRDAMTAPDLTDALRAAGHDDHDPTYGSDR